MKAELKQKWIEALRSGDYAQGRRTLHNRGEFCCLGVLCVVEGLPIETISLWSTLDGYGQTALVDPHETCFRWGLTEMNDSGKSFAEIADWIEQHIPVES